MKFITAGEFSVKSITWVNNLQIQYHPKAKILNTIWRLNLLPRIKLFTWKLIRKKLSTRLELKNIGLNVNGECSFCQHSEENIDHLFKSYAMTRSTWNIINSHCLSPNNIDIFFVDWVNHVLNNKG